MRIFRVVGTERRLVVEHNVPGFESERPGFEPDRPELPKHLAEELASLGPRPRQEKLRDVIEHLCAWRAFRPIELGALLGIRPENLTKRHLCAMVDAGFEESVDIVLSLNGLPIATVELKNHLTGQNVHHAQSRLASARKTRCNWIDFSA